MRRTVGPLRGLGDPAAMILTVDPLRSGADRFPAPDDSPIEKTYPRNGQTALIGERCLDCVWTSSHSLLETVP